MDIALVTALKYPEGSADDHILAEYLKSCGHHPRFEVWTNPTVEWFSYDIVIVRSTWDYQHRAEEFQAWVQRVSSETRLFNSKEIIKWNMNKDYLLELEDANLPIVPTVIAYELGDAWREIEEMKSHHPSGEVILKPMLSASAELTFRVTAVTDAEIMIRRILNRGPLLVQPFLDSVVRDGEISLVFFRGRQWNFSHAVQKLPASGDFRVQAEYGGTVREFEPSNNLIDGAKRYLNFVPPGGLFARVDVVDWRTSPKLGELELIEPELFFRFSSEAVRTVVAILESI